MDFQSDGMNQLISLRAHLREGLVLHRTCKLYAIIQIVQVWYLN